MKEAITSPGIWQTPCSLPDSHLFFTALLRKSAQTESTDVPCSETEGIIMLNSSKVFVGSGYNLLESATSRNRQACYTHELESALHFRDNQAMLDFAALITQDLYVISNIKRLKVECKRRIFEP